MSAFLNAFKSKRVALLIPLGFASGLPLFLTGSTLSAWMEVSGVDIKMIGLFAIVTLPYNFKILWSPILDRFTPPWLGRRRGWMLISQLLLMVSLLVMGTMNPAASPLGLGLVAFTVAFLSASQDIVSDAYRTDVLPDNELGSGTATFVMGYRIALIVAGAGALILASFISWRYVYWIMAALMLVGAVATWRAPDPPASSKAPKSLTDAVVKPFLEFFKRDGALIALCVVMLYKFGDALASHMITPFLIGDPNEAGVGGIGFSLAEVGAINKGFGLTVTIVGALVGGGMVARLGVRGALLLFGALQALANVGYIALDLVGKSHALLVAAIGVDQFVGGLGTAAFVAFLMSLCNRKFSATQYALLSSASSLLGKVLGTFSGYIIEDIGWAGFFAISIVVAAPALLLILLMPKGVVQRNGASSES